jgi:hypothetical protein
MVFFGALALCYRRFAPAAVLFIIDGAAGVGIFWDRWSREAGHHVQISTLFAGVAPGGDDLALLATHLPLLLVGLAILGVLSIWQNRACSGAGQ